MEIRRTRLPFEGEWLHITREEAKALADFWVDAWGWYGKPDDPAEQRQKEILEGVVAYIQESLEFGPTVRGDA